jgi:hypothetical protein
VVFAGGRAKPHDAKQRFEATGLHEASEGAVFLD